MPSEFLPTAIAAIGLVLIVEGIAPFIAPAAWRKYLATALTMNDRTLRIMGLVFMLLGVAILNIA